MTRTQRRCLLIPSALVVVPVGLFLGAMAGAREGLAEIPYDPRQLWRCRCCSHWVPWLVPLLAVAELVVNPIEGAWRGGSEMAADLAIAIAEEWRRE